MLPKSCRAGSPMIKVYPFSAIMPQPEKAAAIACEPYDVINTVEARERAQGNPLSFLRVVRSEIDLAPSTNPYDDSVYQTAAKNLDALIAAGHLVEHPEPAMFIYRQVWQGRQQYGVVCTCDAQQYRQDLIKKHEKTRPDKEDDRTRHMTVSSAHAEPVFLTVRDQADLKALIESDSQGSPLIDFVARDGVQHTIWRIANWSAYLAAFAKAPALYIADGHHRTAGGERAATARQYANPHHTGDEEYNRILSVIFPASHLKILAYHRVIKDLGSLTADKFLDRLKALGRVVETTNPVPTQAGTICVYVAGKWFEFIFPDDSIDRDNPVESLDVSLLQSRILEPILGVGDPRTDQRIQFVGGIRGTTSLEKVVDSGEMAVAFSMFPTSIEQLLAISDAGMIMPPKSTWFEPKLRSGLFVHRFETEPK
jgi:uncharacterized protein (DUF1015 family)